MAFPKPLNAFLQKRGYSIHRWTRSHQFEAFFDLVRPVAITEPLVRIGGAHDGGYLIPDNLAGIAACFSPGVGGTSSFELALAERGIRSFMADYSVDATPIEHPLFSFEKKFLGDSNDDTYTRLEDWVARNAGTLPGDLILQMDIEGGEYPVLHDTPIEILKRFRIMAIEFHCLDMLFSRKAFEFARSLFQKILSEFEVVHLHPNNGTTMLSNGLYEVPSVVEFTFYRRDCVRKADVSLSFPHPLDASNATQLPDVVLPKCWR